MIRKIAISAVLMLLVFPLSAFADSDGYFCAGEGYLTYDLWREGYARYLHVVWLGGQEGIGKPAYVAMGDVQPHGYRCEPGRVSVLLWDHIAVYDVSAPGSIVFVESIPVSEKGKIPAGFTQKNLGNWSGGSESTELKSGDADHRYELRISHEKLAIKTDIFQYGLDGTPLKRLGIYDGNMAGRIYDFEVEDLRAPKSEKAGVSELPGYAGDVADYFKGYDTKDASVLLRNAKILEEFIKSSPSDKKAPEALFYLGQYRNRIARLANRTPKGFAELKDYIENRKDDFEWATLGGYLYSGKDWKAVMGRYPESEIADDAAFNYYTRSRGGECEGFRSCYCQRAIDSYGEFMRRYQESEHFSESLERLEEECGLNYEDRKDWELWLMTCHTMRKLLTDALARSWR